MRTAVAVGLGSLSLALCLMGGGCHRGTPDPGLRDISKSHLRTLASLYTRYSAELRGRPATEAGFKEFIAKTMPADRLEAANVKTVDELFVSERDNKPYVVLYGAAPAAGPPAGATKGGAPVFPVCAYEQEGKDGKRLVAAVSGKVEEVDEARFKQLVPGAK